MAETGEGAMDQHQLIQSSNLIDTDGKGGWLLFLDYITSPFLLRSKACPSNLKTQEQAGMVVHINNARENNWDRMVRVLG